MKYFADDKTLKDGQCFGYRCSDEHQSWSLIRTLVKPIGNCKEIEVHATSSECDNVQRWSVAAWLKVDSRSNHGIQRVGGRLDGTFEDACTLAEKCAVSLVRLLT